MGKAKSGSSVRITLDETESELHRLDTDHHQKRKRLREQPSARAIPPSLLPEQPTTLPEEPPEYQGISPRAQELLRSQERDQVDFKKSAAGLEPEDLVAFANSPKGGAILIGVKETKADQGRQRAEVVGCGVGDGGKRVITDRTLSCSPPVAVRIIVENLRDRPFFRIEIPPSPHRPHCTSGGTYKIRGDGANRPLLPKELLAMFVEAEAGVFLERFAIATHKLEQTLGGMQTRVDEAMSGLDEQLYRMDQNVNEHLSGILESAQGAESRSDEAASDAAEGASAIQQVHEKVEEVEGDVWKVYQRLDVIMDHLGIEPPEVAQARVAMKELVRGVSRVSKKRLNKTQFMKKYAASLPMFAEQAQREQWFDEAMQELKQEGERVTKAAERIATSRRRGKLKRRK